MEHTDGISALDARERRRGGGRACRANVHILSFIPKTVLAMSEER
jgi:hypothetical protein